MLPARMFEDPSVRIGCAGWSLRTDQQHHFAAGPSHLARYARRFNAVEINSSFYRPHLPTTYQRWHDSVPAEFRFSVKMPKLITHQKRLESCAGEIDEFLHETRYLHKKLACLLVQLPPSLTFDAAIAEAFFSTLCQSTPVSIACEPRHPSWRDATARALLRQYLITLVATEPQPASDDALSYFRLHGAPVMYKSAYSSDQIAQLAETLRQRATAGLSSWCIFDNTALGAATLNALALTDLVGQP